MKLAVLTTDPDGPVVRHRVRAVLGHLERAGFTSVAVVAVPKRLHERARLFASFADVDLVLLMRKLFTAAELALLRHAALRLAYDVDDAVYHRDPSRRRMQSRIRASRFARTVRTADLVLAGNDVLATRARDAGGTVVRAPTPVDTQRFVPGEHDEDRFRMGWIGSRSTRPYLRSLDGALADVCEQVEHAHVAVMADLPASLPCGEQFENWSAEREVPFLQSLSAGVMPLHDDDWSRGKCGFKLLQYMACGVPAVASPVGVNVDIADGGKAALLASSREEWVAALRALAADPVHAAELGQAGRAAVEARWSADVLGPTYAEALATCARGERVS